MVVVAMRVVEILVATVVFVVVLLLLALVGYLLVFNV